MITSVLFLSMGGLALFFFGMREMADGLRSMTSAQLKRFLNFFTRNRLIAVAAGATMTAVMQSSSATTVLVVGFVNAGLLTLKQAIGVIMGANIGTTITAWLVSIFSVLATLKITKYAMPAIAIGLLVQHFSKRHGRRYVGQFLFGFGVLFLGLSLMKDAFDPMKDSPFIREVTVNFARHPLLGLVAGLVSTMVLQSSSATIAILQVLAMQGHISFEAALPVLIGDNIGTTITAQFAAMSVPSRMARRAAMAHTLFNLFGSVWALPLISMGIFEHAITAITPGPLTEATITTHIAVSHTAFNVANTIVFLPFTGLLARLATRLTPPGGREEFAGPKYLDRNLQVTPTLGIDAAVREIGHMLEVAHECLRLAVQGITKNEDHLKQVETLEDNVDTLQIEIFRYLAEVSEHELSTEEAARLPRIFHAVNDIEKVSDFGERLMRLQKRLEAVYDPAVMQHFEKASSLTLQAMDELRASFVARKDGEVHAKHVLKLNVEIKTLATRLKDEHVQRMMAGQTSIPTEQVLDDALDYLNSMRAYMGNVAEARLTGKLL